MSEPTAAQLRAKVFEDRETPGDWRVAKLNADGGYDAVKVFTGPDAATGDPLRPRSVGDYDEIRFAPYPRT
jgi:hypothetical protein